MECSFAGEFRYLQRDFEILAIFQDIRVFRKPVHIDNPAISIKASIEEEDGLKFEIIFVGLIFSKKFAQLDPKYFRFFLLRSCFSRVS